LPIWTSDIDALGFHCLGLGEEHIRHSVLVANQLCCSLRMRLGTSYTCQSMRR